MLTLAIVAVADFTAVTNASEEPSESDFLWCERGRFAGEDAVLATSSNFLRR